MSAIGRRRRRPARSRPSSRQLDDAGIEATRDAGAFYPQPLGVLVGLPALVRRGLTTPHL